MICLSQTKNIAFKLSAQPFFIKNDRLQFVSRPRVNQSQKVLQLFGQQEQKNHPEGLNYMVYFYVMNIVDTYIK